MIAAAAFLATLTFTGNFSQGGMVETFAPAGTEIYVNDEKADCYAHHCLIGFGRDFPEKAYITAKYTNGAVENYEFTIKQKEYDIQRINKVDQGKVKPNANNQKRIEKEAIEVATKRVESLESSQPCPNYFNFQKPANTLVTGWFGSQRIYNGTPRAPHSGVDFKGNTGDPIYAPEGGEVIYIGNLFMTGLTVMVDHGCGVTSNFLHLSKTDKKVGDKIKKGDVLGQIGSSGLSTGPHLHWGVNLGTVRLDPLLLVK